MASGLEVSVEIIGSDVISDSEAVLEFCGQGWSRQELILCL